MLVTKPYWLSRDFEGLIQSLTDTHAYTPRCLC